MKKKPTAILVVLLALGVIFTSCPAEAPAPQVGKRAPDLQLNNLNGQSIALSELKGTPVVLNFWATWCGPCAYEMPHLEQFYQKQGDNVALLTVNIAESPSKVAGYMQSHQLSFPVLLDSEAHVAQKYNVQGIPTTFFIDSDGVIQHIKIGAFQSQVEIETILSQLE